MSSQETTQIADTGRRILESVRGAVVGMDEPLTIALATILAGGHVLFEDVPGLGKTLAARSLASALGLDFRRLQCTPDMLPGDVTGSYVYAPATGDFVFRPGPIFTGLLLADEVNRTTPKTQSAMLEAMAEHQVTVEGNSFPLPLPFHVIATSNPIEYEGTYALPEAQLDRFMVRLAVGYPRRRMRRASSSTVCAGRAPMCPSIRSSTERVSSRSRRPSRGSMSTPMSPDIAWS
jgi:MoxR-like ATPase